MKFRFGGEGPKNVNPDRVAFEKTDEEIHETITENPSVQEVVPAWDETTDIAPTKKWTFFGHDKESVVKGIRVAALSSLAATLALNVGEEHHEGAKNPDGKLIEVLGSTNSAALLESTEADVCQLIDGDFMHRFSTIDEYGNEAFNPGAFVVPFAVSLTESCKTKVDIEFHIPYHFARTFKEISAKNPEARDEMVNRLAKFIQQQMQDELVIRGVAGVTDTLMVWDKQENVVYTGKPRIDLSKLGISDLRITGNASAEAEASTQHAGPESLIKPNHENIVLALDRRDELIPFLEPALVKAGFSADVMEHVTTLGYEQNLIEADVKKLSDISRNIFGETLLGTDTDLERAYQLVQEYNDGNPIVAKALEENPEYQDTMRRLFDDNRGVEVKLTANTETEKDTVYPIALALPLLLLALGRLKRLSVPGGVRTIRHKERIIERSVPDTITKEKVGVYDAKRRLFSETTPPEVSETRSFDEIFEAAGVSYEDRQGLLDHLLIEEVLPSLDETTKEPYIDYEDVINRNRQYLTSDARNDGIKKGSYDTTPEAERHVTEDLIEMWERHDAYTYPMQGIDMKTVLNYRHSEHVVAWAKPLAELFVHIMKQTVTTEDFKSVLTEYIREAGDTGYKDRNVFVKSTL